MSNIVEKITKAQHNEAHELIEEFMLVANQVVARHLLDKKLPFIHRIHESPDEKKNCRISGVCCRVWPSLKFAEQCQLH